MILHSTLFRFGSVALALFLLVGCGGGGGGSGSSSRGIRVLHGSVDAAPVDLLSSSRAEGVVQTARFAQPVEYVRLPEGEQSITLVRTKSSAPIHSLTRTIGKEDRISLLVYGMREQGGLLFGVLEDTLPDTIERGSAALQVIHAAFGASTVSIEVNGQEFASGVPYGSSSGYITVPSGSLPVVIRRTVDRKVISTLNVSLDDRKSASVLVSGEVDYFVASTVLDG